MTIFDYTFPSNDPLHSLFAYWYTIKLLVFPRKKYHSFCLHKTIDSVLKK